MKAFYLCLLLLCISLTLHSQNLVPNGDFEQYHQLPNQQGQLENCKHWINPSYSTPDYFHSDASPSSGFQLPNTNFAKVEPYSGSGIVGLFSVVGDLREYISVQLVKPLIKGKVYTLTFAHTNGTDDYFASCGSNRFGVYFSKSIPNQQSLFPILVTPQLEVPHFCWDTVWVKENFTFVADDNYSTLTFGNFYTGDQTITIEMAPAVTQGQGYAYFFLDKVELIAEEKEVNLEMPNVFSPNGDGANDTYQPVIAEGLGRYHLTIYNQWGGKVFETDDYTQGWDGQSNGMNCNEGTYFWRIDYTDVIDYEQSKSGFLNLVR